MKVYRNPLLNMKQSWWSLLLGRGTTQSILAKLDSFTFLKVSPHSYLPPFSSTRCCGAWSVHVQNFTTSEVEHQQLGKAKPPMGGGRRCVSAPVLGRVKNLVVAVLIKTDVLKKTQRIWMISEVDLLCTWFLFLRGSSFFWGVSW